MPVDSKRMDYKLFLPTWHRIEDSVSGERAVKHGPRHQEHLPSLDGMSDTDYQLYRKRAKFYAAPARTTAALVGMVMRKDPVVEVDPRLEFLRDDVDGFGTSFDVLASRVVKNVVNMGRFGLSCNLVGETQDARRPVIFGHEAETIINWQEGEFVVVETIDPAPSDDPYEPDHVLTYRVWRMEEGRFVFEKYEAVKAGQPQRVIESTPGPRGQTLDRLPFVIVGPSDISFDIDDPPIEPIANLALHHYMLTADYNWGLHFVALPTPYATGVTEDDQKRFLGPTRMWAFSNPDTKVGMLEFQGAGLKEFDKEMESDKREMADMGARMLESRSKTAEAAQTVEMKAASDSASLASIAERSSDALTRMLKLAHDWMGYESDGVSVELNKDFLPVGMTAQELTALVAAWQSGSIPTQTYYENLVKGEVVSPDMSLDEFKEGVAETSAFLGGAAMEEGAQPVAQPPEESEE